MGKLKEAANMTEQQDVVEYVFDFCGLPCGKLSKIDTNPPTYLWEHNNQRMQLTAEQVMEQRLCFKPCLEQQGGACPWLFTGSVWREVVSGLLTSFPDAY